MVKIKSYIKNILCYMSKKQYQYFISRKKNIPVYIRKKTISIIYGCKRKIFGNKKTILRD